MNWHNATMCSPNLILITLYIIDPKATTNSFSLSLHDALPICHRHGVDQPAPAGRVSSRLGARVGERRKTGLGDRKSTRLNSSHVERSYAVFCLTIKQCAPPT